MNIKTLEKEYKEFVVMKKNHPEIAGGMVLMNQELLTAAGAYHTMCIEHNDAKAFEEFTTSTFIGSYYNEWKKTQAMAVASLMDIYKTLNVKIKVADCKGETFYAGIPMITETEVATAAGAIKDKGFIAFSEKIGLDGKMHVVDEYGHFKEPKGDDMYGDDSGVTLVDIQSDEADPVEEYEAACAMLQDIETPTEEQWEVYYAAEKKYLNKGLHPS